MATILITKADGEKEPFDESKLRESLTRAGAMREAIDEITAKVTAELRDGMTTEEIYRKAFALLQGMAAPAAARYSMKRAILDLGPSGFPFEDFIGEIWRGKGFTVQTGVPVMGLCVEHEVDLLAHNDKKSVLGEIKFHNELGLRSDLKVALYVAARVEDVQARQKKDGQRVIDEGWLITNTKFTGSAISYARCKNLNLISWTYPKQGNLQDLIEETRAHPLTCLTSLSKIEKISLLQEGTVLCKSLNTEKLRSVGIKDNERLTRIIKEVEHVCREPVRI